MARGELKQLSALFSKYKEILIAPESTVIDAFLEVVEDMFEIKLDKKFVRYTTSTKTLSVTGYGPFKMELKLHEKEIISHIVGRIGKKNAPERII